MATVVESVGRVGRSDTRGWWARLPTWPRRAAILVGLLLLWQLYVTVFQVSDLLVASPADVAVAWVEGVADGSIVAATGTTLRILFTGMGVGVLIAAALTIFATWSTFGDDLLVLLTSMINPLPAVAILPLAVLWFGLNSTALIFVIGNAVVWPLAINVSTGFRTINRTILAVGQNIGLRHARLITDVYLPAALPHILSGLKTSWAFGWRTIIAAELVFGVAGGKGGLGWFINDARYFTRTPEVFAGLLTIALIGIVFDLVFVLIERRTVVRWGMKSA